MAQVTIYLPDDLRAQVKAAGIEVSAVCQAALRRAVTDHIARDQREQELCPHPPKERTSYGVCQRCKAVVRP